jgi:hypothetical protein
MDQRLRSRPSRSALEHGYLWHEFDDRRLLLG